MNGLEFMPRLSLLLIFFYTASSRPVLKLNDSVINLAFIPVHQERLNFPGEV